MLLMDTGQDHTPHALVINVIRRGERLAAIHSDFVATVGQAELTFSANCSNPP